MKGFFIHRVTFYKDIVVFFRLLTDCLAFTPAERNLDISFMSFAHCNLLLFCAYSWFRYILTSFYTKYDRAHFVVNTVSLLTVLIPKLPQLHGVRIFGINKYWHSRRGHLLPVSLWTAESTQSIKLLIWLQKHWDLWSFGASLCRAAL